MRDCMFYVADMNMVETFKGFLTRQQFHQSLGCGRFAFDPLKDLARAAGQTDGGLWRRAGGLCKGYLQTHRHLVVCLDRDFGGSPGQAQVRQDVEQQLLAAGWNQGQFAVLVIDPELEQWIWQDSPHVESALKYASPPSLRQLLMNSGDWPAGQIKPNNPKEVLERLVDQNLRGNRSSTIYSKITSRISVMNCVDGEFLVLRAALQGWFP